MELPLILKITLEDDDLDARSVMFSSIMRDAKDWPGVEKTLRTGHDISLKRKRDVVEAAQQIPEPLPASSPASSDDIVTRGGDDQESIWLKIMPDYLKQVLSIFGDYIKASNTKSPVKLKIDGREVEFSSKQEMTPELLEGYVKILTKTGDNQ